MGSWEFEPLQALWAITDHPDLYDKLKPLLDQRSELVAKITEIDGQMKEIMENTKVSNAVAPSYAPKDHSGIYKQRYRRVREMKQKPTKLGTRAYQIMEFLKTQTRPKFIRDIVTATNIPEPTVRAELYNYFCFSNIRGQGYIYKEPEENPDKKL